MIRTLTEHDIERGWELDYPLSWRKIIVQMNLMPPDVAELLDTLHELFPNQSDVQISPHGEPILDNWGDGRRREYIFSWLDSCERQGLITLFELQRARREISRIC